MAEISDLIIELFNSGVADKQDKNSILKTLIFEGGLDVDEALRVYNKLAREAGMVLSNEEKKEKQQEILEAADLTTEEGIEDATQELCKAIDIAPSTAMGRIREFAKEAGIELPGGERGQIASRSDVVAFLIANKGAERKVLVGGLVNMGYKKATATSILAVVPYMEEYAKQSKG